MADSTLTSLSARAAIASTSDTCAIGRQQSHSLTIAKEYLKIENSKKLSRD